MQEKLSQRFQASAENILQTYSQKLDLKMGALKRIRFLLDKLGRLNTAQVFCVKISVPGSTSDVRTSFKPTLSSQISKWALWEDSIPTGQSGEVSHQQYCRKCCIIAVLPDV